MLKSEEKKIPSPEQLRGELNLQLAYLNQRMNQEIKQARNQNKPLAKINAEILEIIHAYERLGEPMRSTLKRLV